MKPGEQIAGAIVFVAMACVAVPASAWGPNGHAIAGRWVKSVRTECLDHLLILNERHLRRVLTEYVTYFYPASWRPSRYVVEENRVG